MPLRARHLGCPPQTARPPRSLQTRDSRRQQQSPEPHCCRDRAGPPPLRPPAGMELASSSAPAPETGRARAAHARAHAQQTQAGGECLDACSTRRRNKVLSARTECIPVPSCRAPGDVSAPGPQAAVGRGGELGGTRGKVGRESGRGWHGARQGCGGQGLCQAGGQGLQHAGTRASCRGCFPRARAEGELGSRDAHSAERRGGEAATGPGAQEGWSGGGAGERPGRASTAQPGPVPRAEERGLSHMHDNHAAPPGKATALSRVLSPHPVIATPL